jgi:hypothetical protein
MATETPRPLGSQTGEDMWLYRQHGRRCKTCISFVPKRRVPTTRLRPPTPDMGAYFEPAPDRTLGRCRRHAPKVSEGWPAVWENDWCGDHKLDEEKLLGG